ncbi:ATP-dependent helicase [Aeribacillus pallidus]|uniref:UvrD-helicase domain-containing protein n=1 Tax=Aeribacillus pallidus TaxID=33936 RepID=UPI0010234A48|nr:ATP-dependent helicase [Aeribacillus pallidus]RZI52305.1 ATP-dependent helicase [Aeribacillus pallidus]
MSQLKIIDSNYLLEDLEKPFKVIAGPGAGKTHWLVTNIKHILNNSKKLHCNSKIACITYTNVGVEEIKKKLNSKNKMIEVSTIHAFLYKNIVRPYVYLLQDEETKETLVDVTRIKGHFNNSPSNTLIRKWRNADKIYYLGGDKETNNKIIKRFSGLKWKYEAGNLTLISTELTKGPNIRNKDFIKYKKYCWSKGIIHHDDVLYFSYELLKEFPKIGYAISSRFTYIILDEFQDTNELQTEILKILFASGSIIGVVGDPAQSIYQFQGATRESFINFSLPQQNEYKILCNRRSGQNIVDFLNIIRKDELGQECKNTAISDKIYIYQYDDKNAELIKEAFFRIMSELELNEDYSIISYENKDILFLKESSFDNETTLWDKLQEIDADRCLFLTRLLKGYRYYKEDLIDLSVAEISSALSRKKDGTLIEPFQDSYINKFYVPGLAVEILQFIIEIVENKDDIKLIEFYNSLSNFLGKKNLKLPKIKNKSIKDFTEKCKLNDLIEQIKMSEVKIDNYRTIHGVKGAEFQSVLLFLDNKEDLLDPNIDSKDDKTRVFYVGCSRAKQLLFIALPKLTIQEKLKLNQLYGDLLEFYEDNCVKEESE